jgi:hypothetical protein
VFITPTYDPESIHAWLQMLFIPQLLNLSLNDRGTSWLAVILLLGVCFFSRRLYSYWTYKQSTRRCVRSPSDTSPVQTFSSYIRFRDFIPTLSEANLTLLKTRNSEPLEGADPAAHDMRYPHHHPRWPKKKKASVPDVVEAPKRVEQPVDMFIVLDVEGTCNKGTDFNFPNEIIVRYLSHPVTLILDLMQFNYMWLRSSLCACCGGKTRQRTEWRASSRLWTNSGLSSDRPGDRHCQISAQN